MNIRKITSLVLVFVFVFSFTACKKTDVPELDRILNYSVEQFDDLASSVDEKDLIKAWGEPQALGSRRFWRISVEGETTKFVVAWVENGNVTSIHVSKPLFINVAAIENGVAYCVFGWNYYSTDAANLAFMPTQDCFGNEIACEVGDQFIFQFDGMIMESYPAQINAPYSAVRMGHLSDEEISEMASNIVLP
ncbi:MAG: hypothetical protein IKG93_01625 [Clostridiales bacterium]|nr:hypothetical protein [Clostridiales bacterium]MBR3056641.1 hypothetical protein [Clostridiales bacterium]